MLLTNPRGGVASRISRTWDASGSICATRLKLEYQVRKQIRRRDHARFLRTWAALRSCSFLREHVFRANHYSAFRKGIWGSYGRHKDV
jgi:hypothetical protein